MAGNSFVVANGATQIEVSCTYENGVITITPNGDVKSIVFDDNGAPISVVWGTATYTDFVKK